VARTAAPVAVETDVGTLLLPADDQVVRPWMAQYGTWEPEEAALLRGLAPEGGHVVDLGAHVGYHTLVAAAAVGPAGRVTAVEANPDNARLLRANVAAAGATQVTVVHAAAWDSPGRVRLNVSSENSGDHRVGGRTWGRGIRAVTVDSLVGDRRVDVVKSDLQGRDHVALRGMAETIRRWHPVVLTEFWPLGIRDVGDDPYAVLAEYATYGYTVTPLDDVDTDDLVKAADSAESTFLTLRLDP
jgi:FkbM family methyltransferase